jgi:hypothetical protein
MAEVDGASELDSGLRPDDQSWEFVRWVENRETSQPELFWLSAAEAPHLALQVPKMELFHAGLVLAVSNAIELPHTGWVDVTLQSGTGSPRWDTQVAIRRGAGVSEAYPGPG